MRAGGSLVNQRGGRGPLGGREGVSLCRPWSGVGQWLGSRALCLLSPEKQAWLGLGGGGGGWFLLRLGSGDAEREGVGRAWGRHHLHGLQGDRTWDPRLWHSHNINTSPLFSVCVSLGQDFSALSWERGTVAPLYRSGN